MPFSSASGMCPARMLTSIAGTTAGVSCARYQGFGAQTEHHPLALTALPGKI